MPKSIDTTLLPVQTTTTPHPDSSKQSRTVEFDQGGRGGSLRPEGMPTDDGMGSETIIDKGVSQMPSNFQNAKKEAAFPFDECDVAERVGLARDLIRKIRQEKMTEGVHWILKKKRVFLSAPALKLLADRIDASIEPPTQEVSPEPANAKNEAVLCAWMSPTNTRILEAYVKGTDPKKRENIVRVRVKSNINFTRGLEFKAKHVQADLYDLIGACPRSRGRF